MKNLTGAQSHYSYLDGLRGLSALYIVIYHAQSMVDKYITSIQQKAFLPLTLGRFSVAVFIVLSGYCLMLPVVRSQDHSLSGGFWGYMKRRSRRILPPYYLALVLSVLIYLVFPSLQKIDLKSESGMAWFLYNAISPHLFLIHNLNIIWAKQLNSPLWSVATEYQIYLLFPLILIPMWKRFGIIAMVCSGFVVGLLPFYLFRLSDLCSPWFLGVFALGAAGAIVSFSSDRKIITFRETISWGRITAVLFGSFLIVVASIKMTGHESGMRENYRWVLDALIGLAVTSLLIYCTEYSLRSNNINTDIAAKKPLIFSVLDSKAAVSVGMFSYTLYLLHYPLLQVFLQLIRACGLKEQYYVVVLMFFGVPLIVCISAFLYILIERPFLSVQRKLSANKFSDK